MIICKLRKAAGPRTKRLIVSAQLEKGHMVRVVPTGEVFLVEEVNGEKVIVMRGIGSLKGQKASVGADLLVIGRCDENYRTYTH